MITLFVDVDGTLYNLDNHPNEPLIGAVQKFVARNLTGVRVVVWSGGGVGYADSRGTMALGWLEFFVWTKDKSLPQPGDFVIDDMLFVPDSERVSMFTPDEFVKYVEET